MRAKCEEVERVIKQTIKAVGHERKERMQIVRN
jgi:hypothetical protein